MVDALAKRTYGLLGKTEDAAHAGAERVDHYVPLIALAQENERHLRMREVDAANYGEAGFVVETGIQQNHIHQRALHPAQDGLGIHFTSGDFEIRPAAQSAG